MLSYIQYSVPYLSSLLVCPTQHRHFPSPYILTIHHHEVMEFANGTGGAAAAAPAGAYPTAPPANGDDAAAAASSSDFKLKFCTVCASNQNRYDTIKFLRQARSFVTREREHN